MKKECFLFTIVIAVLMLSCSKDDITFDDIQNPDTSIVSNKLEGEILAIADIIVNFDASGVSRQSRSIINNDDPIDGVAARKYIAGLGNCYNVRGNCLDDVIVTPSYEQNRINIWNNTSVGKKMQTKVVAGLLNFDYIENENGLFLFYKNIHNQDVNMVIPLK